MGRRHDVVCGDPVLAASDDERPIAVDRIDVRVFEDVAARARELINERAPELEIEGEMHGDAAISEEIRLRVFPRSRLRGEANLLIMPTLDAANIAFNLLKTAAGGGVTIGPILLGAARPVHILTPSASVRRLVNMTALAVADANAPRGQEQSLF